MSDPNIFAVLTAHDRQDLAGQAFRLQHNVNSYFKSTGILQRIAQESNIDSRESTPAWVSSPEEDKSDRIVLRLDKSPKNPSKGWQFGTNQRHSDILLGHRGTIGISSFQFCNTITQLFRVEFTTSQGMELLSAMMVKHGMWF